VGAIVTGLVGQWGRGGCRANHAARLWKRRFREGERAGGDVQECERRGGVWGASPLGLQGGS